MRQPKFLADEDFREDIVQSVLGRDSTIDFLTIRQVGLRRAPDSQVLQFAWQQSRIVVSHDANTMIAAAIGRIISQTGVAGLIIVPQTTDPQTVAEDLVLIANASESDEWRDKIDFLPW